MKLLIFVFFIACSSVGRPSLHPLLAAQQAWKRQDVSPLVTVFGPPDSRPNAPREQIFGHPKGIPPASAISLPNGRLESIMVMPSDGEDHPEAIKKALPADDWTKVTWDSSSAHVVLTTVKEYSPSLQVFFTYYAGDETVFYVVFCRNPESPEHKGIIF